MISNKRINISNLREHPALNGKIVEEESTSTEEDLVSESVSAIQWEINQIKFIQKITFEIENRDFLSEFLLAGFKFYVNKVLLYFLNKDPIRKYRKSKEG